MKLQNAQPSGEHIYYNPPPEAQGWFVDMRKSKCKEPEAMDEDKETFSCGHKRAISHIHSQSFPKHAHVY